MTLTSLIDRYLGNLSRHHWRSGLLYLMLVAALCLTTLVAWTDIVERIHARDSDLEILAKLKQRSHPSPPDLSAAAKSGPPGSPFLEGQTVTLASASLLQRLSSAITRVSGRLVSSEVESRNSQPRDGYVGVIATCELEEPALQQLLYDLEAGMPYLFVHQLVVDTPSPGAADGRLQVRLGVSGLWVGAK
jgi:general secretion pathway protein M